MSISVVVRWRLEVYYTQFFFLRQTAPPSGVAWGVLLVALCSLRPSTWPREPIMLIFYFGLVFFISLWKIFFSTAELVRVYETPPPSFQKIIIIQDDIKEELPQQHGTQRQPPLPHALNGTGLPAPQGEQLGLLFPQPLTRQESTGCRPRLSG
jgi:hypothetical protein